MRQSFSPFVSPAIALRSMSTAAKKPSTLLVGLPVTDRTPTRTAWSETPVSIYDEIKQITKQLTEEGYVFECIG